MRQGEEGARSEERGEGEARSEERWEGGARSEARKERTSCKCSKQNLKGVHPVFRFVAADQKYKPSDLKRIRSLRRVVQISI